MLPIINKKDKIVITLFIILNLVNPAAKEEGECLLIG